MSKSGLYAHFGSKQELQLVTVEEAGRILDEEVAQPALAAPLGLAQLVAVCEAFFDYLQRRVFPGGCFFAAAALEMGTRPRARQGTGCGPPGRVRGAGPRIRGHRARAARASRPRGP
jgi:AcrR family transcriptional regulator